MVIWIISSLLKIKIYVILPFEVSFFSFNYEGDREIYLINKQVCTQRKC